MLGRQNSGGLGIRRELFPISASVREKRLTAQTQSSQAHPAVRTSPSRRPQLHKLTFSFCPSWSLGYSAEPAPWGRSLSYTGALYTVPDPRVTGRVWSTSVLSTWPDAFSLLLSHDCLNPRQFLRWEGAWWPLHIQHVAKHVVITRRGRAASRQSVLTDV